MRCARLLQQWLLPSPGAAYLPVNPPPDTLAAEFRTGVYRLEWASTFAAAALHRRVCALRVPSTCRRTLAEARFSMGVVPEWAAAVRKRASAGCRHRRQPWQSASD